MGAELSLSERIMDAAEEALRQYGAAKTNLTDMAGVLGMSHVNIYRCFPSKKALLNAVAARWLHRLTVPLQAITEEATRPAGERLAAWFDTLRRAKRDKHRDDPHLFRVYYDIVDKTPEVIDPYLAVLLAQLEHIIADGMASGEFAADTPPATAARVFLMATVQFYHPALVAQDRPPTQEDARALFKVLLTGLHGSRRRSTKR